MKHLKMLGLTVIVALGLTAFVGSGTSSATTLCTFTDTPGCTSTYTAGTIIHGSLKTGTTTRTTSGGSTIGTCTASTFKGKTTNTSATWITVNIEQWTWPAANCLQTTHTVKLGKLTIMWIEGTHNGTVELDETEVTKEIFGVTCTYGAGAGTHLGTFTGGSAPVIAISSTFSKTAGGFLCPGSVGVDGEYIITEPHSLFVVS